MATQQGYSKAFSDFLELLQSGKQRKAPDRAEELLALPLAPDARAFLEAWSAHVPPHVAIDEFWFDDRDPGGDVPPEGDMDLVEPSRTDVLMFGTTPGGDLWAFKKNTAGEFAEVVRIVHDEEWSEYAEADSFDKFIEHYTEKANEEAEREREAADADDADDEDDEPASGPRPDNSIVLVALEASEQRKVEKLAERQSEGPSERQISALPEAESYLSLAPAVPALATDSENMTVAWLTPAGIVQKLDRPLNYVSGGAYDNLLVLCDEATIVAVDVNSGQSREIKVSLTEEDMFNESSYFAVAPVGSHRIVVQTFARILLIDLEGQILSAHESESEASGFVVGGNGSIIAAYEEELLRLYRVDGDKLIIANEIEYYQSMLLAPDGSRLFVKATINELEQWYECKVL